MQLNRKTCEGNIRFDSNIYLDMIFTLHESLIINKIGCIKDESVKKRLILKLKIFFAHNISNCTVALFLCYINILIPLFSNIDKK